MTSEQPKVSSDDFLVPDVAPENPVDQQDEADQGDDRQVPDPTPSKRDRLIDRQVTDAHLSGG